MFKTKYKWVSGKWEMDNWEVRSEKWEMGKLPFESYFAIFFILQIVLNTL